MTDALEVQNGKVGIDGRTITNLQFVGGIDALAEKEQELEALVDSIDENLCNAYNRTQAFELRCYQRLLDV